MNPETVAFVVFAAALAVFGAIQLSAAPAVPLVNLVDERTLLAISITDAPALVKGWDGSPFAKTWDDPQVVKFLAPLRETMKIEEWDAKTKDATGSTVRELLALADGEAMLAIPSVDFEKLKESDSPPFLMAIHVGDRASKLEKILADATVKAGVAEQTEVYAGSAVHIRPFKKPAEDEADSKAAPETFAWAMVDGVWLVSAEKERVFAAVDALKNGGVETALGKNAHFLAVRERVGDAQSLGYLNIAAIYPLVRDAIAARKAAGDKSAPMGADPDTLMSALGLDALSEAFVGLHFGEKEARVDAGLTYSDERGILKLIAYQPGPAPQPEWIPAKWPSVSTAKFSVPQAYSGLEQLFAGINPLMAAVAQGKIAELNRKMGIDLKRDLIGSLGDDIISGYALPPGLDAGVTPPWNQMDQLFAVSLKNVDAFTQAIEAIKQTIGGPAVDKLFVKRVYLDQTICTFTPPAGATPTRGFSYAIAGNTLLIGVGSASTVESAIQGMRDGQGAFWKRDDIKSALATMRDEACSVQFTDMRVVIASLLELATRTQENGPAKPGESKNDYIDVTAKPDAEVISRYWGMAAGFSTKTANGFFSTSRLAYPQP